MSTRARIESVTPVVAGTVLAAALTIGDDTLQVFSTADFRPPADDDPPALLQVAGAALAWVDTDDADDYGAPATPTVTLAEPSPVGAADGRVDVLDANGEPVVRYIASVVRKGFTGPTPAVVAENVVPHIRTGTDSAGWTVEIVYDDNDDTWVVTRIIDRKPAVSLAHANDEAVNPVAVTASFEQFPEAYVQKLPASAVGEGTISAPVDFTNLKAGGFRAGVDGFQFTDAAGGVGFSAGADGARIGGDGAIADVDYVRTSKQSQMAGLAISVGTELILDDTLAPPGAPPNGTPSWPTQEIDLPDLMVAGRRHSVAIEDLTHGYTLATNQAEETRLVRFNPTTGAYTSQSSLPGPTSAKIVSGGFSTQQNLWASLVYDGAWKVRYSNKTTGAYDHQWTVTALGSDASPLPAIAVHSYGGVEYVMIARSNPDGTVTMWRYDNQVFNSTVTSAEIFDLGDVEACTYQGDVVYLTGMMHKSFPDGVPSPPTLLGNYPNQAVVPIVNFGSFFGTPGTTAGWMPIALGDKAGSLTTWDADTFNRTFYLSRLSDTLYQHGDPFRNGSQCVKATEYHIATGHESDPSPAGFITKTPGNQLTFTMGAHTPGSPYDAWRFYLGAAPGAVDPGDANMWLQATTASGVNTATVFDVLIAGTNLAAARTPGTSPSAAPLKTRSGKTIIAGGYSSIHDVDYRLVALEAGGGGGGGSTGGRVIDGGAM